MKIISKAIMIITMVMATLNVAVAHDGTIIVTPTAMGMANNLKARYDNYDVFHLTGQHQCTTVMKSYNFHKGVVDHAAAQIAPNVLRVMDGRVINDGGYVTHHGTPVPWDTIVRPIESRLVQSGRRIMVGKKPCSNTRSAIEGIAAQGVDLASSVLANDTRAQRVPVRFAPLGRRGQLDCPNLFKIHLINGGSDIIAIAVKHNRRAIVFSIGTHLQYGSHRTCEMAREAVRQYGGSGETDYNMLRQPAPRGHGRPSGAIGLAPAARALLR